MSKCYPVYRTVFDRMMQQRHSDCCLPEKHEPCYPQIRKSSKENYSDDGSIYHRRSRKMPRAIVLAPEWCGYSKKAAQKKNGYAKKLDGKCLVQILTDDKSPEFKRLARESNVQGFPHTIVLNGTGGMQQFSGYLDIDAFASKVGNILADSGLTRGNGRILGGPEKHTCSDGSTFTCSGGTIGCVDNSPRHCG